MVKRGYFSILMALSLIFISSYLLFFHNRQTISITGFSIQDNGSLGIYVWSSIKNVTIHSPINTTYYFTGPNKYPPFFVQINASASFRADEWRYEIYGLRHPYWQRSDILANPGYESYSSIEAYRWQNKLVVSAREGQKWYSQEVYFYVNVSNSAPEIQRPFNEDFYVCEGDFLSYSFLSSDVDEDDLSFDVYSYPNVPGKFLFGISNYFRFNDDSFKATLFSRRWQKEDFQSSPYLFFQLNVSASDGEYSDYVGTNVTVMQVNNVPLFQPLTSTTIWVKGENSNFSKHFYLEDIEDGSSDDGNFIFNISFGEISNLFDINQTGFMEYSPKEEDVGVYNISVCAKDRPLENPHQNISLCYPKGYESNVVCDWFQLTITDSNRAPKILNYSFLGEENLSFFGLDKVLFWVEIYDPDGNIPDVYWYDNGVFSGFKKGEKISNFSVVFPCDFSGLRNVSAVVSDGLENVSISWNISVKPTSCPLSKFSGGGVGASFISIFNKSCIPNWVCGYWQECQNVKRSRDIGVISPEEYFFYKEICDDLGYDSRFCGFQIRFCEDLNSCNLSDYNFSLIPKQAQVCYFTENPSCFDGIKNCHSGGCEVLVDCGGPCKACSSCSDKVQNQGEEGIDCGGPCPRSCEKEYPYSLGYTIIFLIFVLFSSFMWIIYKSYKIVVHRKEIKKAGDYIGEGLW